MSNYLGINNLGNLRPSTSSYNLRESYFNNSAVNLSSAPMFYVGSRMNVLGSENPHAYAMLKFGSNKYSMYDNIRQFRKKG